MAHTTPTPAVGRKPYVQDQKRQVHKDRRTRRLRTRAAQRRQEINWR